MGGGGRGQAAVTIREWSSERGRQGGWRMTTRQLKATSLLKFKEMTEFSKKEAEMQVNF